MADFVLSDERREQALYRQRLLIAAVLGALMTSALVGRYFWLQVVQHERYVAHSDQNRIHTRPLAPARGLIYAADGQLLAENRPSLTVFVIPEHTRDLERTLARLRERLELREDEIRRFRKLVSQSPHFARLPLRSGLEFADLARLAVDRHVLPGVEVAAQLRRHYPHGELFSHALGYVGAIAPAERRALPKARRRATFSVGKVGIERAYEKPLRGRIGYENVEVDAWGRVQRLVERRSAVNGRDLRLHLDVGLQRAARDAMGEWSGAVVALEPATGAVLAMLSLPDFDPNRFVAGFDASSYRRLLDDSERPLFNRASRGQYAPASTFKPIVALAALESGQMDPDAQIADSGRYQIGDHVYYDWLDKGHGHVDMHRAIVESCDTYFYDLASRIGLPLIVEMARGFGFGAPSGLDLPLEASGLLPTRDWKARHIGERWYDGDTLNLSIGQGYLLATPVQMALLAATMATRGERPTPRLVAGVGERELPLARPAFLHASSDSWERMLLAMEGVVHEWRGTASGIGEDVDYRIVSKTGTVQLVSLRRDTEGLALDTDERPRHLRDHAIFIGYAGEYDAAPQIALAVVIEHGRHGGRVAAPIARRIFDAHLRGRMVAEVRLP